MTVDYLGVLSPDEVQHLRASAKDGRIHPVVMLALADGGHQVATNTAMWSRAVFRKNPTWVRGLRPRLLDLSDFTNASSALGEVRAYGALLETWMNISPEPLVSGKRVVPEFAADAGDGPVIVEVHSRQLDGAQTQTIAQHHEALNQQHKEAVERTKAERTGKPVITTGLMEIAPLGAPKQGKVGDSVLTNAISRVARIKENEHQIDPNKPFVLWLDFQDPTIWGLSPAEEQFAPLYTECRDGMVSPGAFWFALYGRRGDPMIESRGFDYKRIEMLHDGRFTQVMKAHGGPTRVSAVIFSLPRATVLMENPTAPRPLPPRFRASILKAPFFRLDLSLCEWKPGLVTQQVESQRSMVRAASEALSTFDP